MKQMAGLKQHFQEVVYVNPSQASDTNGKVDNLKRKDQHAGFIVIMFRDEPHLLRDAEQF